MLADIVNSIICFDIFINNTTRLSFVLSTIFVLKVALILPLTLRGIVPLISTPFYLLLSPFMFINLWRGLIEMRNIDALISGGFFYVLIILGGASGAVWSKLTKKKGQLRLNSVYVQFNAVSLLLLCFVYFILYANHYIVYFGLGIQTYVTTAAVLAEGSTRLLIIPFVATILTGKRGLLIVLFAQYSQMITTVIRQYGVVSLLVIGGGIIAIGWGAYNYGLLNRFQPIFEISWADIINHTDQNAFHRLYLATSGRSNEVFGFLREICADDINLWVGFPADFSFKVLEPPTGKFLNQHYFHVSYFNYVKHFGIIVATYMLIIQAKVAIFSMRNGINRRDVGLLLYVGYFFGMFFGAIVMIDILYWVVFSYAYFQMKDER